MLLLGKAGVAVNRPMEELLEIIHQKQARALRKRINLLVSLSHCLIDVYSQYISPYYGKNPRIVECRQNSVSESQLVPENLPRIEPAPSWLGLVAAHCSSCENPRRTVIPNLEELIYFSNGFFLFVFLHLFLRNIDQSIVHRPIVTIIDTYIDRQRLKHLLDF